MPNNAKRELRAILDRIASSRALMDVPAMVAEGRSLAASVKGAAGRELAQRFDTIAAAETSTEATMAAADALVYLDSVETTDDDAATPATERARPARSSAPTDKPPKSAAARKRAPSKRAGGK